MLCPLVVYNRAFVCEDLNPSLMHNDPRTLERAFVVTAMLAMLLLSTVATAQNTAGVFPPGFGADHASAQYRITYEADEHATAHRFHYQQSINRELLWRVIALARKTDGQDLDFDAATGELFWTLSPAGARFQHGLRFDAIIRNEGRPASAAANWGGQYELTDRWRVRGNLLSAVQVGDGRQSGVFVQTRGQLHYRIAPGRAIGIEHYGVYGSSRDFRGASEQRQQLGPYVDLPLAERWRLFGSVLFGLTDGSQDLDLKLWVTRSF